MQQPPPFQLSEPRTSIEIRLPDGRTLQGPRGAPVGHFLEVVAEEWQDEPLVGALVNGELRELTYELDMDALVRPISMAEEDGMRIYRRGLTFILAAAFEQLHPGASITIDHSVAAGGYFCQVRGRELLTPSELDALKAHMQNWVDQDLPIVRERVQLEEAVEIFESRGHDDKVKLLAHRKKDFLMFYRMGEYRDYHHGYMVPSTGFLRWFDLLPIPNGFSLRFPRRRSPTVLSPMPDYPIMLGTFHRYGSLLERLGIASVGALNDATRSGRIREVVLVSEALHERRISELASEIAQRRDKIQVILIAGPSSAGKTTSSRRLSVQLLANGITPFPLEMDNYFVERDKTPRDENGDFDFEHIDALDRPRLTRDVAALIQGKEVQLPHFDFKSGSVSPGEHVQLRPDQVILIEGIHGLNPQLLPDLDDDFTFRIYISALTQLNLDRHNRVSTTDTRMTRRIIRDARTRGYTAQETIKRWDSVTRGEKRNIFPYQENCDAMFNSALVYELAAMKRFAEPQLRQVPHGTPEYVEAKRLLSLLEWFDPLPHELVPDNSLLREFLGGSILQDFKIWH
jgi:uridine kinase